MKILKILILSIAFFATKATIAQPNVLVVNNNVSESFTLELNFLSPCPPSTFSIPGNSVTANSYCVGGTLSTFILRFTDNTCSPPNILSISVPYTTNPTNHKYTRCDGTIIDFNMHFNGIHYILDIN